MASLSVALRLENADQVSADFELLAQAAERSERLRQALLDLGDLAAQVRCVQGEPIPAAGAHQVLLRLELADGLAGLVRAVRAGEFDRG